jgi:hypothetical protein
MTLAIFKIDKVIIIEPFELKLSHYLPLEHRYIRDILPNNTILTNIK